MEKKIVITRRFRNNTLRVYQYLLKEFSVKTANLFLDKLKERIELIAKHPTIGKPSVKKKDKACDGHFSLEKCLLCQVWHRRTKKSPLGATPWKFKF